MEERIKSFISEQIGIVQRSYERDKNYKDDPINRDFNHGRMFVERDWLEWMNKLLDLMN